MNTRRKMRERSCDLFPHFETRKAKQNIKHTKQETIKIKQETTETRADFFHTGPIKILGHKSRECREGRAW